MFHFTYETKLLWGGLGPTAGGCPDKETNHNFESLFSRGKQTYYGGEWHVSFHRHKQTWRSESLFPPP